MIETIKKFFLKDKTTNKVIEKLYLNVPYSEKDQAKGLGAKWDPQKKLWYIPAGIDHVHFAQWMIENNIDKSECNIRSKGFYIVESFEPCWKCKLITPVFSFLLPEYHQTKEYEDEDDDDNNCMTWQDRNYKTIISFVDFVSPNCVETINKLTTSFYLDFSKQNSASYYMNHCQNCASKLGDFYMHSEPGGAFMPMTPKDAELIKLYRFNHDIKASAGNYSLGVNFFDYMKLMKV